MHSMLEQVNVQLVQVRALFRDGANFARSFVCVLGRNWGMFNGCRCLAMPSGLSVGLFVRGSCAKPTCLSRMPLHVLSIIVLR